MEGYLDYDSVWDTKPSCLAVSWKVTSSTLNALTPSTTKLKSMEFLLDGRIEGDEASPCCCSYRERQKRRMNVTDDDGQSDSLYEEKHF
ncbi:hypothetical protein glysoja_021668 [Glycine soja]|nr:hypothetical protein glysoja_021668 [Glycine soja]